MTMPGWSGIETLRHLRSYDPEATVLLVSGYSDDHIVQAADAGFLQKPYSIKQLARAIESVRMGNNTLHCGQPANIVMSSAAERAMVSAPWKEGCRSMMKPSETNVCFQFRRGDPTGKRLFQTTPRP